MIRSCLTLADLGHNQLLGILERMRSLKDSLQTKGGLPLLEGKVVGLLFEKPSTRTRVSFEAAALRLGARCLYLSSSELQLKRGEPIKDTARILGSYLDALVARVYDHSTLEELAQHSGIPIINGLSDLAHPTQAICDLFTVLEVKGGLEDRTLAYIGDGNNVCRSLMLGCTMTGMGMVAACPPGYGPGEKWMEKARALAPSQSLAPRVVEDPREAVRGADVLYTDVWVSMGEEAQKEEKRKAFSRYQINDELLALASPGAVVMHCLPAYRGLEITEEVLEGPRSVVWRQAENKMYAAAAVLEHLLATAPP